MGQARSTKPACRGWQTVSDHRSPGRQSKTVIQALDCKDPVLPLSPGRAERHGFEYFRHGTPSLYAAFNTRTETVLGKTAQRRTSAEFVAFLTEIVANQPTKKDIHVIADNVSAHKTDAACLARSRIWKKLMRYIRSTKKHNAGQ